MSTNLVCFTNSWIISHSSHHRLLHHLQFPQPLFSSNRLFPLPRKINFLPCKNQFHRTRSLQRFAIENPNDNGYGYEDGKGSTISREDEELKQARDAVSEILQHFGVSKEESIEIALNSPKYIEMLMDGVRELDELNLWNSWSSKEGEGEGEEVVESGTEFKKKVYYMAKKKGDKGKLPLLESVGLSLSSSMHLARYLSSQTLPDVILKVKYMKEILFSGSNDRPIGKNARRMMMHLSIPVDEDLQQTLSFFEKIQARRGGLDLLDSGDTYFRYLIESFPRLLLLKVESKLMPKVEFLESIGVPKGCMRNILLLFPPIIFYDIEKDIKPRVHAFEKVNVGDKDFGRMLLKYPWILSESIQENCEEILSFFDMKKVPKVSVERAIKSWPHILGCSTTNLKSMVREFDDLGIRDKKLGQVIAKSAQLLLQELQVVQFLEDLELDEESIGKILGRCPEIFGTSIDNVLKKKVKFLIDMGVSRKYLPRVIKKYPEVFVCDIDKALRPRMKYLMEKGGLSKRQVVMMVTKFPPILGYSVEEVLRPKLRFLVMTMRRPVSEVVEYPRFFSYSLEKRIQPRFWVLKSRNLKCSLKDMLAKNDDEFTSDFILPHALEVK